MSGDTIPTTERLARALEVLQRETGLGYPLARVIDLARKGHYDDYKTTIAYPQTELVRDLAGLVNLGMPAEVVERVGAFIGRVQNGEFDATQAEGEAWARSDEGRATLGILRDFFGE